MTDTQIIEKLKTELDFFAKNPDARAQIKAADYAKDLLAFIHVQQKIAHLKSLSQ